MRLLLSTVLLFIFQILIAQEICDNGIDDDGDGLVDIQDDDCFCIGNFVGIAGDFEDISCCPDDVSQLTCQNEGWINSGPSTDLVNTCGYVGGIGFPFAPLPFPSGNGAIGINSRREPTNSSSEGVRRCLDCSLIAGEAYEVRFFVGFNSTSLWSSDDVGIGIYGKEECGPGNPGGPLICPDDGSFIEMATINVEAVDSGWVAASGTFIAPGNYSSILLKVSCSSSVSTDVSLQYHYLDDIQFRGNFSGPNCGPPPTNAQLSGDCSTGFSLSTSVPGATQFQWYLNGAAIPGATTNPWSISPLTPGDYQVRVIRADGSCTTSPPTTFDPDLNGLVITADPEMPTCAGGADGSIDLTFTSPNPPFTIDWSNGGSGDPLTGLSAGTYTATVTDANGCSGEVTTTVTNPEAVTSVVDIIQPTGGVGGSVSITTNSGTPPFTYTWSNGLIGPDQDNLSPGLYLVTVTDANGCEEFINIFINDEFNVQLDVFDAFCGSECLGEATLTPLGGTPPYFFIWSVPGNGNSQSNLCPGIYTYTIADSGGSQLTGTFEIVPGGSLDADIEITGQRCSNSDPTNLDLTVTTGTAPYTYNWSTGATTEDLNNVTTGSYTVTITDATGCEAIVSTQLDPVDDIQLQPAITDASCQTPGSITVTATGGTPPISYLWSNGQTGAQLLDVPAGSYTLTATDANGCTVQATYTVSETSDLTATATITPTACVDDATGAIDLNIGSGAPPFTFAWSNGAVTEDISGLLPGNYSVTITDDSGCDLVNSYAINFTSSVVAPATIVDASCPGSATGSIVVSPVASLEPLSYVWSNGETTSAITGLLPDVYDLTITDNGGCDYFFSYGVDDADFFQVDNQILPNACFGDAAASIAIIPLTPGNYSVIWSDNSTDLLVDGLTAGDYSATVTNDLGCEQTYDFVLIDENSPLISDVTEVLPSCGEANGSLTLVPAGGVGPYEFNWSNGEATATINNLSAATYAYTITDAVGCELMGQSTLDEEFLASVDASLTPPVCADAADGSIDLTISGGAAPITVDWSTGENGTTITDLAAGDYSATITDANGCILLRNYTLTPTSSLSLDDTVEDASCPGSASGSIAVSPTANLEPLSFIWSNGETTSTIDNLSPDLYELTITDNGGCAYVFSYEVVDADSFELDSLLVPNDCFGGNAASIEIIPLTPGDYTAVWSNNSAGLTIDGLSAGDYAVTVSNDRGCEQSYDFVLTDDNPQLTSMITEVLPTCGEFNGSLELAPSGGLAPYTFNWSGGQTEAAIGNLSAGQYVYTITDALGCTLTGQTLLEEESVASISATVTQPTCADALNGSIELNIAGAAEPITVNWSNGDSGANLNNLGSGTYTAEVTDANGCFQSQTFTLETTSFLDLQADLQEVSCFGGADGAITTDITASLTPLTYSWSNNADSPNLIDLTAGTYELTITDAAGCTYDTSFVIDEPAQFIIDTQIVGNACFGGSEASITILPPNDGTYTADWDTGETGLNLTGLAAGDYITTVTSELGCDQVYDFEIIDEVPLLEIALTTQDPICGEANGVISSIVSGGNGDFQFQWNNNANTSNLEDVTSGDYTLVVTDQAGCTATASTTLTPYPELIIEPQVTDLECNGQASGSIALDPSGGTAPYAFSWSNGSQNESVESLLAGLYEITLTDALGCALVDSFLVDEPQSLSGAITDQIDPELGLDNGSITATVSGGTPPYDFSWSTGQNSSTIDNLSAGDYELVVTDANGCTINLSASLVEPIPLSVMISSLDNRCPGVCEASIRIEPSGGTPPYSIQWSDGQNDFTAIDLCAGQYEAIITDANGNFFNSGLIDVTSPEDWSLEFEINPVSCTDAADGSITTNLLGGTLPYQFVWDVGDEVADLEGLSAGSYRLDVEDANGCVLIQTVEVPDYEPLSFDFSARVINCDWDEYEISISGPELESVEWLLNGELYTLNAFDALDGIPPGIYELTYREQSGCTVPIQTFEFTEEPAYTLVVDESVRQLEFGQQLQLSIASSPAEQVLQRGEVSWETISPFQCLNTTANCVEIEINPEESEVVLLNYRDENDCRQTFRIPIIVTEPDYLYVPNAFSPNEDGVNDRFSLFATDFVTAINSVRIYNRWGGEVYSATELNRQDLELWDGQVNGQAASIGVYIYVIELELANGLTELRKGDVSLIR
ncbi:MAG: gliding motility-associated C-terminal domain-containing protein [Bacteroidota bacterium]